MPTCPTCGTPLTLKNKAVLLSAGLAMVVLGALAMMLMIAWLMILAVLLAITGVYLMLWATRGKGLWCRSCKKAPYLTI